MTSRSLESAAAMTAGELTNELVLQGDFTFVSLHTCVRTAKPKLSQLVKSSAVILCAASTHSASHITPRIAGKVSSGLAARGMGKS